MRMLTISGRRAAAIAALACLIVGHTVSARAQGNPETCQPFQSRVVTPIESGEPVATDLIAVPSGRTYTIEQIALRIDALTNNIAPTMASLTTTISSITSAYYVPIPADVSLIGPYRPLTLMQSLHVHSVEGTQIRVLVALDPRYLAGTGSAEWSVSGKSCPNR
jgi:hypothetical protein